MRTVVLLTLAIILHSLKNVKHFFNFFQKTCFFYIMQKNEKLE
nr:MAG TPA: hypothetical protein [Caudoviricetes sp.]